MSARPVKGLNFLEIRKSNTCLKRSRGCTKINMSSLANIVEGISVCIRLAYFKDRTELVQWLSLIERLMSVKIHLLTIDGCKIS